MIAVRRGWLVRFIREVRDVRGMVENENGR
jgi:hypothetical protein